VDGRKYSVLQSVTIGDREKLQKKKTEIIVVGTNVCGWKKILGFAVRNFKKRKQPTDESGQDLGSSHTKNYPSGYFIEQ